MSDALIAETSIHRVHALQHVKLDLVHIVLVVIERTYFLESIDLLAVQQMCVGICVLSRSHLVQLKRDLLIRIDFLLLLLLFYLFELEFDSDGQRSTLRVQLVQRRVRH